MFVFSLPIVLGIIPTYVSGSYFTGEFPTNWRAGFPFEWKIISLSHSVAPCPPGIEDPECFHLPSLTYSTVNFALDWVFYSLLGYALLALFIILRSQRRRRKKTLG